MASEKKNEKDKIVTLCGSTKFKDEFLAAACDLTLQGCIVLMPGVFGHCGDKATTEQKIDLDALHKRKIDLADEILVINVNDYIGESTRSEIDYATKKGMPVKYLIEHKEELDNVPDNIAVAYDDENLKDVKNRKPDFTKPVLRPTEPGCVKKKKKSKKKDRKHENQSEDKWKQVIVARKDLYMSPGKLAAQVSHASMAFLTNALQEAAWKSQEDEPMYYCDLNFDPDMFEGWLGGTFTKVCLSAKNKKKLDKVIESAQEAGMVEGRDFFVIRDRCLTELEPEETNEDGFGCTITCVGFAPMKSSRIDPITRKLQLLK